MPWPAINEFTDAVQNPGVCFEDPELATGMFASNPMGFPQVWSGNFAAVYKMNCGSLTYAVRCFTKEVNYQQKRYEDLDEYLRGVRPDVFVSFLYRERGIRLKGVWYPAVRMQWVEGRRLDRFVEDNLGRPDIILDVCARWRGANGTLRGLRIAHNDLQHGNVMVQADDAIRLVDYDGIYLPDFLGERSPELGHQHYQHPKRTDDDYNEHVDNFPALVIYVSLLALSVDPGLWQRFYNQDNLILTREDYADPAGSDCFRALKGSPDATVRHLADYLERCCSMPVDQVPDLESILSGSPAPVVPPRPQASARPVSPQAPAAPVQGPPASQPAGVGSQVQSLLQMAQAGAQTAAPGGPPSPAPAPPATPVPAQPAGAATYILCPRCNQANARELVYCDNSACAAVLYAGNKFCAYCGQRAPINGTYCPECGSQLR